MLYGSESYRLASVAAGSFVSDVVAATHGPMAYCTYMLHIVLQGRLDVKLSNQPWYSLHGPAAWLVPPGQSVSWRRPRMSVGLAYIHFTVSRNPERDAMDFNRRYDLSWPDRMRFIEPGPMEVWGRPVGGEVPVDIARLFVNEAISLCTGLESEDLAVRQAATLRLEALLLYWLTSDINSKQDLKYSEGQDIVDRVFILMEHLGPKVSSVQKMASSLGIDPRSLAYHFKTVTGRNLDDALIEGRMRRAVERLTETKHPIPKIAEAVGYADASGFRRMFKNFYGCTPSQYRRRYRLGRI